MTRSDQRSAIRDRLTDDGRLFALLALGGLAVATAARGSKTRIPAAAMAKRSSVAANRIRWLMTSLTEESRVSTDAQSGRLPGRREVIFYVWRHAVQRIPISRFPEFVRKLENEAKPRLVAPGWGSSRKGILTEKAVAELGGGGALTLDGYSRWPGEYRQAFRDRVAQGSIPKNQELLEDGLAAYVIPFLNASEANDIEAYAIHVAQGGWA